MNHKLVELLILSLQLNSVSTIIKAIIPIIIGIFIISIIVKGYVKAPPDKAFIISGIRDKVIIGKSSIVIPIVERVDELFLGLISVDVKNNQTPTNDFVLVDIDGVVKLEVDESIEGMKRASKNFLNDGPEVIAEKVIEVLEGNMREITGQMTLENMIQDRKAFGEKVEENATPDMEKMGLRIVAFNIQSFNDETGIIEDLGAENVQKIKKNAEMTKADAEKDVRIKRAETENLAHIAEVDARLKQKERMHDAAVKEAQLKRNSETELAKAEKAKEIELERQGLLVEKERMNIVKYKAEENIRLKEQELEATIKKEADAEKYAIEQQADANLYKIQKDSEADKARRIAEAEAKEKEETVNADSIRKLGEAKAEALKAQGLAEAVSIEEKAKAMKLYDEAAKLEMLLKVLPEISAAVAKPLENIDKITMYGEGNINKMTEDITKTTRQIIDGVADSTGINLNELLNGFMGGNKEEIDYIEKIKQEVQKEKPVLIKENILKEDTPTRKENVLKEDTPTRKENFTMIKDLNKNIDEE